MNILKGTWPPLFLRPLTKLKETLYQKTAVLSLRGKLMGPPASTKLYEDVINLLENGVIRIVFDLSHVNWINSLGVGAIVKCYTAVEKYKGLLHLVGLTEKVKSIFVMSQLTKIFTIHDSVDNAVAELNNT